MPKFQFSSASDLAQFCFHYAALYKMKLMIAFRGTKRGPLSLAQSKW